jgi:hypothetical protein
MSMRSPVCSLEATPPIGLGARDPVFNRLGEYGFHGQRLSFPKLQSILVSGGAPVVQTGR